MKKPSTGVLQMIDPASPVGIVSYVVLIIFGFAAGGKVRRLSKEPQSP